MPRDAHTVARINHAVKTCVEEASQSDDPLGVLVGALERYRDSHDWTHDEVAEFEEAVLLILRKLHAHRF